MTIDKTDQRKGTDMPTKEIKPMEAEAVNYRKPKRPTVKGIALKPYAVVMLAWAPDIFGEAFDQPADRDFEGFDNLEHAKVYYEANVIWATNDWASHKDMRHMIILVDDTKKLNIFKKRIFGGTAAWRVEVAEGYEAKPVAIFHKTLRERILEERKVNKVAREANEGAPARKVPKAPVKRGPKKRARNTAAPVRQNIQPRARKAKK